MYAQRIPDANEQLTMAKDTLDLQTVTECNRCLGCRTLHPQVSIINLEKPDLEQDAVKFEFYAILLIEECTDGCCCCGRKYYDYSNATMVFLQPGEIFKMSETDALPDKGWLLAFHPALLHHTFLKSHIKRYTFFSYSQEEALHLSQRETATIACCLENIEAELHQPIDTHTATILSRHIELMLDYCSRFYERQFITRENRNTDLLEALEALLDDYINSGKLRNGILPTSQYCATETGLSVAYFDDLLKFETGRTLDEHFQFKRLETAKKMLLKTDNMPATVASQLGYPNVQQFSFLFTKITGFTPDEYKCTQN